MRRLLASVACLWLVACFGRSSSKGEFRLDRAAIAAHHFDNALFQTVGVQPRPGNQVEVVNNGRVFDVAIEEIARARSSIHVVSFIWSEGKVSSRIVDALSHRTRDGIPCRVIVDALGSPNFANVRDVPFPSHSWPGRRGARTREDVHPGRARGNYRRVRHR